MKKEFRVPRKDGTKATVTFVKHKGVWFWEVPKGSSLVGLIGGVVWLPLPDVALEKAKTVKECLDLIAKKRGKDWVGQVIVDLLKVKKVE